MTLSNKSLTQNITREEWLIQSADIITDTIICQAADKLGVDYDLEKFRVSIGNPQSKGALGECWAKKASSDGYNEIFITPHVDDSAKILATLVHELIHAADDLKSGHQHFFAQMARECGLVGKLTATTAGTRLNEQLLDIVDALGDIPHSKLSSTHRVKKSQTTRMLKVECSHCGFHFRASRTQIDKITIHACNACDHPEGYTKSLETV